MDVFGVLITIVVVVVVVLALLYIRRYLRKSRDPEYAASLEKKKADRDLERQKRRVEKAELKVKKAKYQEAIAPYKAALNKAKSDYESTVKKAEDGLRHAQHEHEKQIHDQEKAITDIHKKYTAKLASVGDLKVFVDKLMVKDTSIALNPTFSSHVKRGKNILDAGCGLKEFVFRQVQTEDEKPSHAGDAIGGIGTPASAWEVIARPDWCYLFVEGTASEYSANKLTVCVPLSDRLLDDGDEFAKTLNKAAADAQNAQLAKERETQSANERLAQIKADTSAIERARSVVENVRAQTSAVDEAQRAYDNAVHSAQQTLDYHP